MRRLWLIFAQTVTVCIAVLFVVKTLKPEWLAHMPATGGVTEVATVFEAPAGSESQRPGSHADAAKKAVPAVVHIFTSQEVKGARHPFMNDPIFRHFFGDRFGEESQRRSGLGSGAVSYTHLAGMRSTARSDSGSEPTTRALYLRPSLCATSISSAPSMTWKLVRM